MTARPMSRSDSSRARPRAGSREEATAGAAQTPAAQCGGPFARKQGRDVCVAGHSEVRVSKRLYVGNLPYTAGENALRDLFAQYG
ncbi:MAG: RNA-binding protein, partial [Firmicutes bacterium]|nr:RNA-binding protein [Bacillota bacterium]